jgi:hypothetical protein
MVSKRAPEVACVASKDEVHLGLELRERAWTEAGVFSDISAADLQNQGSTQEPVQDFENANNWNVAIMPRPLIIIKLARARGTSVIG